MTEIGSILEAKRQQALPPSDAFERLVAMRGGRARRRRFAAVAVGVSVAAAGLVGSWIAFRRGPQTAPIGDGAGPPSVLHGVPSPPETSFRLRPVPVLEAREHTAELTTSTAYLANAERYAREILDFYRRAMPARGWRLVHLEPLSDWARYRDFPQNTFAGGQTWLRGGRTVRIYVGAAQSAKPMLSLLATDVPVTFPRLRTPVLIGGSGRHLVPPPPGSHPALDGEDALHRAWIDFVGASASRVEVTFGLLTQRTSPSRLAWRITYRDACLPASEGSNPTGPTCPRGTWNELIDASTGQYMIGYTGSP